MQDLHFDEIMSAVVDTTCEIGKSREDGCARDLCSG